MNTLRKQMGMTVIGWVLTLVVLAFGVLFVLRLVPLYTESFKIDQALSSIIRDPSTADSSRSSVCTTRSGEAMRPTIKGFLARSR